MTTPRDILDFWFSGQARSCWFVQDDDFDGQIRARFGKAVQEAQQGGFDNWRQSPEGTLALLILLDQAARNLHRGTARAFLGDQRARQVAAAAIDRGFDRGFSLDQRQFFYLPFEHGETMADQERAVDLFRALFEQAAPGERDHVTELLDNAHRHRDVIRRFGRFPQRNAALGRDTTEAETAYLKTPVSVF